MEKKEHDLSNFQKVVFEHKLLSMETKRTLREHCTLISKFELHGSMVSNSKINLHMQ